MQSSHQCKTRSALLSSDSVTSCFHLLYHVFDTNAPIYGNCFVCFYTGPHPDDVNICDFIEKDDNGEEIIPDWISVCDVKPAKNGRKKRCQIFTLTLKWLRGRVGSFKLVGPLPRFLTAKITVECRQLGVDTSLSQNSRQTENG